MSTSVCIQIYSSWFYLIFPHFFNCLLGSFAFVLTIYKWLLVVTIHSIRIINCFCLSRIVWTKCVCDSWNQWKLQFIRMDRLQAKWQMEHTIADITNAQDGRKLRQDNKLHTEMYQSKCFRVHCCVGKGQKRQRQRRKRDPAQGTSPPANQQWQFNDTWTKRVDIIRQTIRLSGQ